MKIFHFTQIIILLFLILIQASASDNRVSLSSNEVNQGGVLFIKITEPGADAPSIRWMDKNISLLHNTEKSLFEGFITADLEQKPGTYDLDIIFKPSGIEKKIKVRVLAKDYGVRRLTLPKNKVNLNDSDLKRANKESAVMNGLWNASAASPYWNRPFIMPLDTKITGTFGRRSIINDQPRSPHTGVDMSGKKGTPVKASNSGVIVLTGDHFFTGSTVVIDHGAGILSMYFHLDKINVKKGDKISRGGILGTVGSTGRATGPHLHWGIRVNNNRVDPSGLVEISKKLEE